MRDELTQVTDSLGGGNNANRSANLSDDGSKLYIGGQLVVNNDGGGIFQFLPVAEATEHFEELFATPHGLDFRHLAALCGASFERPRNAGELRACIREHLGNDLCLVEVRTERPANVDRHRELQRIVAAVVEAP